METETIPTIIMANDRDNSFDSSTQLQTSALNPIDPSTMTLNSSLITVLVSRSVPPSVENKIPFIGDVHEDDVVTSSWIFPTAALTKSKSSQDIPFVPTVEENGVAMIINNDVPLDGSYVGDKKMSRIVRAALTEEKEIPFIPPEVESNGSGGDDTTTTTAPPSPPAAPQEGRFIKDRKSPITKPASNESRDIDFAPAGSSMETAAPPMDGSFSEGKLGGRLPSTSNHDIDVVPDLAGKDMPTSPPPKQGTFSGRYDVNEDLKIQEIVVKRTDIEINFSPGACEMTTGPPPISGSYNQGQQGSPLRGSSGPTTEIHVLPEDIGTSLIVTPPRPGRFVKKIKDEDHVSSETHSDTRQGDTLEMPPMNVSDSWVFPQLEQDAEQEIVFSTGGGRELEPSMSPLQGSFSECRHRSPLHDSSTHREIHVTPDLIGKNMPTSAPPNDGSFSGKLDYSSQDDEVPNPDFLPSDEQQQSMNSTIGEVDVDSQDPLVDGIAQLTKPVAVATANQRGTVGAMANVDTADDEEEDDPMKDDQEFWRSQRAWESAKLKQKSSHTIEQAEESTTFPVPTDDDQGQVIIDGDSSDPNPLADPIHKLGALLGSTYEMKPVDSHDEETYMSHSIQKIGALLGSTHLEDPALDNLNDPLHHEILETTSDDILDDLLGDDEVVVDVEGEISHSESIVDLCPLPEFNKRSDSKVHDDDVTVQIENTTRQRHSRQAEEKDGNINSSTVSAGALSDDMFLASLPNELSDPPCVPDEYLPDDEMANLEALLEKNLDTSLLDFGKSIESSQDGEGKAHDAILRSPAMKGQAEDEPYFPSDSIVRLEALLDHALDSPLHSPERRMYQNLAETNHDDDSVNSLDDFLDKALDSDVEITFEPTEDEITAPVKSIPPLEIPKVVPNRQMAATSRSRFGVLALVSEGKSKQRARVDQLKAAQDPPPPSRKAALPKFRGTQKTSTKQVETVTKAVPAPKPPVPRFGQVKAVTNHIKSSSVKGSSISARSDSVGVATNSQNQAALTRTRRIISRFRPWTKRATDSAKALCQDAEDDCQVPMFTPAESRNKGRATPVRLFGAPNNAAQGMDKDVSSKSINRKVTHNKKKTSDDRPSNETPKPRQRIQLTNMAALPKRTGNFYELSSLARSTSSLSSTCSVTHFRSPRREGIRGCQHKFNPYLHDVRGPCELCVFFLSDEDRAALDAQGRHVRVMFTTGGCCRTCAIFPRSFDDQPARLCRICYSNSHRILQDRKSSKRGGRRFLESLSNHDESSSEIM